MKSIIIMVLVTSLAGCGSMLRAYADYADSQDLCQTRTHSDLTGRRLKPDGYQQPDYCGGQRQTLAVIRTPQGKLQGVITNR